MMPVTLAADELAAAFRYLAWRSGTSEDVLSQIQLSHQRPPIANLFTEIEESAA